MIFIGIDNGINGGISAINETEGIVYKSVMPVVKAKRKEYDIDEIIKTFNHLKGLDKCFAVLEKAHPRPISGKRQCFNTGYGYGIMQTALAAVGIPYELVNPTEWQKDILKGLNRDTKIASIMFCKRKWVGINLCATPRCTTPHDGISDSLAMALYAKRKVMK